MLGLTLREEFRGKRLKGTAIELSNDNKTGATENGGGKVCHGSGGISSLRAA